MSELANGATGLIEPCQEMPGIGRIVVQHADIMPSEDYLDSVAARLAHKVNVDKAGQGRKGKWDVAQTVLLVDISTAHLAMLLGQDGLAAWLDRCRLNGKTCRSPRWPCPSATSTAHSCGAVAGTGQAWTLPSARTWNPSCPRWVCPRRLDKPEDDGIDPRYRT